MTRGDRTVLVAVVLFAALSIPLATAMAGSHDVVELRGPSGVTRVDPGTDGVYVVEGRVGDVVFEVVGGTVRCASSSCPDQVCVHSGTVRPARPVVCAPNGVVATCVASSGGSGLDAVSR